MYMLFYLLHKESIVDLLHKKFLVESKKKYKIPLSKNRKKNLIKIILSKNSFGVKIQKIYPKCLM